MLQAASPRMSNSIKALCLGAGLLGSVCAAAAEATVVNDQAALTKLLGKHNLTLQWVSWEKAGLATVEDRKGTLYLKGQQTSSENGDKLLVDGVITSVNAREFTFKGSIITQVSYIAEGKACERNGEFTFTISGKRQFWRMQQMENPCEAPTIDYVDLRFNK